MRIAALICIIILTTCASKHSREEHILDNSGEDSNYQSYLADESEYTTDGIRYHKKYYKHLIGLATVFTEEKKLDIVKKSIGFYYDKKRDNKNELYLGLDLIVVNEYPYTSYNEAAVTFLRRYLCDVIYTVYSCRTVFEEDEIIGIVVGFKWERDNKNESVNIWIYKKDVLLFEEKRLTFEELIYRNFITNSEGKIIKLPI